jgi:chromosome segregation ATPase
MYRHCAQPRPKLVQKKAADALDKLRASQETAATLSEELERVNDFRARAAAYMQSELLQQEQIDTLMQEVQDLRAVPAEPMSDAHSSGGVDSGPSAEAQAELIVALENQLKVSHLRETELSMELAQTQEHLQATLDEADQQRSSVISVATPSSSSKRPAATATINAETPDPNNRGLSPSPSPSSSSSAKKRSKHAANAGGGELSAIRAARRAANARIKDMSAALDTKTTEIETLKAKLLK